MPPAQAAEGCFSPETALLQAVLGTRGETAEDKAFVQTLDGKFLAAALEGRLTDVKQALDSGANLNARDKRRRYWENSALDHAARMDNVELAKLLVSRGMDVNARLKDRHTALHVATGLGRARVAEFLLQNKADTNIIDKSTGMPLDVAVLQARPTMAKLLLKYGAGKNSADRSSPLKTMQMAGGLCPGHKEIIKLLIDSGTDLFAEDERGRSGAFALVWRSDETAMMLARDFPSVDWSRTVSWNKGMVPLLMVAKCAPSSGNTFEYLLNQHPKRDRWRASVSGSWGTLLHCPGGKQEVNEVLVTMLPDVNVPDPDGKTPLHVVRDPKIIVALLKKGARVNAQDVEGRTPLFYAIHDTGALIALLDGGADASIEDKKGVTLLHHAVTRNASSGLKVLLDYKVDPDLRNREGKTALHFAHEGVAAGLISGGADVNAKDANGQTPLHSAAARASNVMGLLLEKGADPMARAADGTIPLHHVRRHEAIPVLVGRSKDSVNAQDSKGRTPLHYVAEFGSGAAIYLLRDSGAAVNAADNSGNTPLHLAALRQNIYTINYLIKIGANPNLANKEGKSAFDLVRDSAKEAELTRALRGETPPR